jgi:hypothetical protein
MGKPVIIFHGDKGGVGKSTAARAFAHWVGENGIACSVVEMDARNPDIYRTYGRALSVSVLDARQHASWLDLVDFVEAYPEACVMIDFPAGAGGEMADFGESLLAALSDLGRPLWVFWLINRGKSGLRALSAALDDLAAHRFNLVVVKNGFYGDEDRFVRYSEHAVAEGVQSIGGRVAYMPALHDGVFDAVDDANLSFAEALDAGRDKPLRYSHRMELGAWLRRTSAMFGQFRGDLGI